jgi:ParB family chromosome partitioning protein
MEQIAMEEIVMIPLTKLVESEDNVRRVNRKDAISSLAQSLKAFGLIHSIVVRENGKGKFAVVAGGRRLRALRMLAKAGDIENNAPIPCRVISGDNAIELSLAENVARENLLAWEELDAYKRLIECGEGPEAIAARFGVSPTHVARRLKLARVSPRLIEALKREEASLDQLAALAFSDDHAAQEKAFFDAPDWARTPERLKAQLAQAHVQETDKLARFVGIEAYQAEGGTIVSDLFAEANGDDTRYLSDRHLLVRLAAAKLQPVATAIHDEGWAWVETAIDGVTWTQFPERVREHRRELSAEERAEQDRLFAKLDETEDEAEIAALEAKLDAYALTERNRDEVALAGAIVTLSHNGEPRIERGLVRADDVKALRALRRKLAKPDEGASGEGDAVTAMPKPRLSAKLVYELMAHKTLALRAELASQPDLALRITVFALAANAMSELGSLSLIRIRVDEADVSRLATRMESKAPAAYAERINVWRERLPSDAIALWSSIASAETDTLLELLAVLAAPAIELRAGRGEHIGDLLCQAANLDMSKYWAATPESYFEHVRKDVLVDAIREEKPTLDRAKLEKAPKAELIARAKRLFKGSAWLPEPLRTHAAVSVEPHAVAAE